MTETRKKLYHSISEVSVLLDVKPHVLRYWESQFKLLRPKKNRAGNRMYREKDMLLLERIKTLLYTKKYTIAGAKKALLQPATEADPGAPPAKAQSDKSDFAKANAAAHTRPKPAAEGELLLEVRKEIETLRDWLQKEA